ncbi:DNA cytosine methyltransferase, partial [Actinophytocola sp.]|uniref:DNA cytosine methyltransferase n=1 Tax=Actinophytocola sp. TaxID=1872138 RepID=UPI0025C00EFB
MTDLFCGAGGSSSGAEAVAGVRVRMASNHWALAIETHNTNLPHVDHDIADVSEVDPRRYPYTDLAWFSPECTYWSQSRGHKQDFAVSEDQGALFGEDGRPLPSEAAARSRALMQDVPRFADHHRYKAIIVENVPDILKWTGLTAWRGRMRRLGYRCQIITLDSAFCHQLGAPAPQFRSRAYFVFTLEIYPVPDLDRWTRPQAWCPTCDAVVTAVYAAKNPDRPFGRYGQQYLYRCPAVSCRHSVVHPYVLPAAAAIDWTTPGDRIGDRSKPLAAKTIARIEAGLRRYARPTVIEAAGNTYERRPGVRAWPVEDPLRTLHTTASKALACPPFLTVLRTHGGTVSVAEPMRTLVAGTVAHALLVPVEGRDGKNAQPTTGPARTQTARNETGLLVPAGGTWNTDARPVDEPMRTRTTRDTEAVVVVPMRNHNRPKSTREPFDTFAANGRHHALLMRNNSSRGTGAEMSTPVTEPMRTLTTTGHQSLVWNPDLLVAYDTGTLRTLGRTLPTQTTIEGDALLESGITVQDCLFRMLMPEEIKLGMAFAPDFVLLG